MFQTLAIEFSLKRSLIQIDPVLIKQSMKH